MIDALPADAPAPYVIPAKKPGSARRTKRAGLFIGAVIILSDGTECLIVGFHQDGTPLCAATP